MIASILIASITCIVMILGILLFPRVKVKRLCFDTYWIVALVGAVVTIAAGLVSAESLKSAFTDDSAINPVKILLLFLSMTLISIFLDEVGFFKYLANRALRRAGESRFRIFAILYWTVSLLTVFTSNDIVVLTFTPFICYFAKNANIDPKPYLVAEFIAANTMSMLFIIGNPTNIYVATSYGINFVDYFLVMALPTMASALLSFGVLCLLFRKSFREPIVAMPEEVKIEDKPLLAVGLFILAVTTLFLVVGPYIGVDMWLVSVVAVGVLVIAVLLLAVARRRAPRELGKTFARAPWQLIPFVLSMFVLILALTENGVTEAIGEALGTSGTVWKYGALSFLSANVINNIPMSVLFSSVLTCLPEGEVLRGVYATVIGSNLGAFLTPIGALAGIMWMGLLKKQDVKMSYLDFIKYGSAVAFPSLAAALGVLCLMV